MEVVQENLQLKSKNLKISRPNDIVVTYSWSGNSHKICGHNFEAFELTYKLLKGNINDGNITYLIPDKDDQAQKIHEVLKDKYQKEIYSSMESRIIHGKPTFLIGNRVILCDGCLPTKGIIHAEALVLILCSNTFWWTKNITNYTGNHLELWYDERLNYNISKLVHDLTLHKPDLQVVLRPTYVKNINFDIYSPVVIKRPSNHKKYLCYVTGNCRDMCMADKKYHSDTLKEIKDIITNQLSNGVDKASLLIVGWNPDYKPEEKIYYDKNKDAKDFQDRKLAAIFAGNLSEYFGFDVEIIPELDLPVDNILELFDSYIYTPTEKNWDCSSRFILECRKFHKEVVLTPTAEKGLETNLGLKVRLQDAGFLPKDPK